MIFLKKNVRCHIIKIFYQEKKIVVQRKNNRPIPSNKGPKFRINEFIKTNSVRLIDEKGNNLGVLDTKDAIKKASDAGLDLVEVSPQVDPPVCKILDFGKFKYEAQKRKNEARKKQKIIEVKEIKLRPNIDSNDFIVKMKQVKKFICDSRSI